jgi:sec-independent protein translocase protein TatC
MRLLPRRLRHGEEATLVEHLGELRARLVISLLALVAGFTVAYVFHERLIHWLEQALPPDKRHLVAFSVTEPFITSVMVSLYAGFLLAIPIIFWQAWAFFAPAFDESAQRAVAGLVVFATVLGLGGLMFGYFVALPAAVHFLTNYDKDIFNLQPRARDYLSFSSLVLLATTVVFEVPIFILGLVRVGVLSYDRLKRNRRIGYVLMAALAVALPGVDPVTTTLEMLPLMLLFEGSIWLSYVMERRWRPATRDLTAEI